MYLKSRTRIRIADDGPPQMSFPYLSPFGSLIFGVQANVRETDRQKLLSHQQLSRGLSHVAGHADALWVSIHWQPQVAVRRLIEVINE